MKKDEQHFSTKRIEEAARTADVIGRAKAASPLGGGRVGGDLLGNRGDVSALNSGRDRL
jgi:hypothetical protein